eukprot:CCRYP_018769-RA/>CCRYP_018769-RA protein AED:0.40 eAED:0.40 QI:0/0/0/1/0/0/3/0/121
MRSPSDFFQRCVFAASGRSNTNSSKPNDGSSPAPTTDSPLALATPTANPPSVAKCVSTMPPTLPIMARLDMQRWCRYGCPLDPLENSPWSMLFDENGLQPDQFGDTGGEYRNLVGVPGGRI